MMVVVSNGRRPLVGRCGKAAAIFLLSVSCATYAGSSHAHEAEKHEKGGPTEQPVSQAVVEGMSVPRDVELRNQDGQSVRFYRDLVAGKVVAINTIYTTCVTICPTMGIYFAELQRHKSLSDRIGRDVNLISISIDPGVDTPDRLKAWSNKLGALPGWTLLTGNKARVQALLAGLGIQFPGDDKTTHSQLVLIGNDSTGRWTYVKGDTSPSVLAEAIDAALDPH